MSSPKVCVLKTDGINCDMEMSHAFKAAGGEPEIVHINQLRNHERKLRDYSVLAIPGGFSYGDDIASGTVLAGELTSYLSKQLKEFVSQGKPVIGICNGYQVLVRAGLLPGWEIGKQQVTLAENQVGRFECRWINLAAAQSVCKFAGPDDFPDMPVPMQVAHGEGRFFGDDTTIRRLTENGQIVFRYVTSDNREATDYPENPNGSVDNIAGICDPSGLVLGMMPHPERSVAAFHPHRALTDSARNAANTIFRNIVDYAADL